MIATPPRARVMPERISPSANAAPEIGADWNSSKIWK